MLRVCRCLLWWPAFPWPPSWAACLVAEPPLGVVQRVWVRLSFLLPRSFFPYLSAPGACRLLPRLVLLRLSLLVLWGAACWLPRSRQWGWGRGRQWSSQ